MSEEAAIASLFQASLEQFVTLRKQLCSELKAAGNGEAAGRLAKLKRPTVSVWVVNQLWWHERDAFEALFTHARRMSSGDLSGAADHRRALAELREAARRVLQQAGHPASDATLRRIATTLAALAAAGSFEPDAPGALQRDRDPPGFEAFTLPLAKVAARAAAEQTVAEQAAAEQAAAEQAARAAAERAERLAAEEAERKRVESELAEARELLETRRARVDEIAQQLEIAERERASSRKIVAGLEQRLAALRKQ